MPALAFPQCSLAATAMTGFSEVGLRAVHTVFGWIPPVRLEDAHRNVSRRRAAAKIHWVVSVAAAGVSTALF